MDTIKAWIGLSFIALITLFAVAMTFNVKSEASIVISLNSKSQLYALMEGREPDTTFVSIQNTPFAPNIKILRVKTHFVWGGESNMHDQLSLWLDDLGITSYPHFSIKYLEDVQNKEREKN